MKSIKFFLLFFFIGYLFAEILKVDYVYQLTDANYDDFLKEHPSVLLKLHAPWCGHCKNLAPEFIKAAQMMEGQPIVFAEMDATKETETAEKLQIEGYPTVLFFHDGKKIEYPSDRSADAIVAWCSRKMKPAVIQVQTQIEFDDLYNKEDTTVLVVFLGKKEGENYAKFKMISKEIEQSGMLFVESNSEEVIQKYQPKNQLLILKKFDVERVDLEEGVEVEKFIKFNRFPAVMELNMQTAEVIFSESFPCMFLFLSSKETQKEANELIIKDFKSASKHLHNKMFMTITLDDAELAQRLMEFLSISPDYLPNVYIIDPKEEMINKYKFQFEAFNEDHFVAFYEAFSNGELQPFFKSQEIPEQEFKENVKQLVGKNFEDFLTTEKDKYILIKFYAPWCPHCKKFESVFSRLAGKLSVANKKIIFAEIDSTENEIDKINIQGVPTVFLYKPRMEEGSEPVEYNDRLTELKVVEFLKKEMNDDWVEIEVDPETEEDLIEDQETQEEQEEEQEEYEYDEDNLEDLMRMEDLGDEGEETENEEEQSGELEDFVAETDGKTTKYTINGKNGKIIKKEIQNDVQTADEQTQEQEIILEKIEEKIEKKIEEKIEL